MSSSYAGQRQIYEIKREKKCNALIWMMLSTLANGEITKHLSIENCITFNEMVQQLPRPFWCIICTFCSWTACLFHLNLKPGMKDENIYDINNINNMHHNKEKPWSRVFAPLPDVPNWMTNRATTTKYFLPYDFLQEQCNSGRLKSQQCQQLLTGSPLSQGPQNKLGLSPKKEKLH